MAIGKDLEIREEVGCLDALFGALTESAHQRAIGGEFREESAIAAGGKGVTIDQTHGLVDVVGVGQSLFPDDAAGPVDLAEVFSRAEQDGVRGSEAHQADVGHRRLDGDGGQRFVVGAEFDDLDRGRAAIAAQESVSGRRPAGGEDALEAVDLAADRAVGQVQLAVPREHADEDTAVAHQLHIACLQWHPPALDGLGLVHQQHLLAGLVGGHEAVPDRFGTVSRRSPPQQHGDHSGQIRPVSHRRSPRLSSRRHPPGGQPARRPGTARHHSQPFSPAQRAPPLQRGFVLE